MKYVSHLDMTRYFSRLLKQSGIPVWHTEGFNKHIYLTFALPLSLGFTCDYDIVDIKLTDDFYDLDKVTDELNSRAADGIKVLKTVIPFMKTTELSFAGYRLTFKDGDQNLLNSLSEYICGSSIIAVKKGKKGRETEINIAEKIKKLDVKLIDGALFLDIVLPAGNTENVNPMLIIDSFCSSGNKRPEIITASRYMLFDSALNVFI